MLPFPRSGDDAPGSGPVLLECVLLGSKEMWLREMATGQAAYNRPLSRVRIFRVLTEALTGDDGAVDQKMASLAFGDEEAEVVEIPELDKTPPRKRKVKSSVVTELPSSTTEICKRVQVPSLPRPHAKQITVAVALDKQRRLWVHVDSLPWLLQFIKEEKEAGGVEPVESSSVDEWQSSRIYWNFRDASWIARAKTVDGCWLQASRGIKRKHKLEQMSFQEAKAEACAQLEDWVGLVDIGQITGENHAAYKRT